MKPVSLIGTASAMPRNHVDNDFFSIVGDDQNNAMFKGAKKRYHVSPDETPAVLITQAAEKLIERYNLDPAKDIDIIITNVTVLDLTFNGCGAEVAHMLGAKPQTVIDTMNCGCVSFVTMMELARNLMQSTGAKTALICNVQNSGGRIFAQEENRAHAQSMIPGDGCGVGLLVANDEKPITHIKTEIMGEYATDMSFLTKDNIPWWEPQKAPLRLKFDEHKLSRIVFRGNKLVPKIGHALLKDAGKTHEDVDYLITNQPNPVFLRNWRESFLLKEDQHFHSFEEHGNMFGAAMPVMYERAAEQGKFKPGSTLLMAGFAHAGDYAAGALITV